MDLKNLFEQSKKAQEEFSTFSQEQVDKIFYEASKAANDARLWLAKMAVEETGMGVIEDKVIKNNFASEMIYNKYKNTQTVGTFFEDKGLGIQKVYEPAGMIGAIIPTTNPTSTAFFKTLIALKTRNSIIIAPHPRARKCTIEAAKVVYEAAIKAGAPENIIMWLPEGSGMEDTTELMKQSDLILATGGSGLVKAAYSSGTPSIGVGAGNCPAIIDESADIQMAVSSIIQSNTFDNGVVCATENSVIVDEKIYDEFLLESRKQGAYVVSDPYDIQKIEKGMFKEGQYGLLNPDMVGQTPQRLGEIFGIEVPEWAKILLVEAVGTSYEDALAHEKLSTMASLYKSKDFYDALRIQSELLILGPGHTSSIYVNEELHPEKVEAYKNSANTGRMLVNMPASLGAVGDLYNFGIDPTLTIGCGTWGGNSYSENIGPKHLLNIKTLASRRDNMQWIRIPEKVYYKYGCLGEALKDLKDDNLKKVFIVTDEYIWKTYGNKLSSHLSQMNIDFRVFQDVEPNPSLRTCKKGAELMESYQPNAIIGFGGGSSLDAAKIMWLFYEQPEADFKDLSLTFLDIRKRIVKFPKLGQKAKMISIPTTAGTGSEVTPFAVITDEETHIKYPLADYAITPNMAIVDAELMMTLPPKLTASTGMDAFTHSVEAAVSLLATEFTDPYAYESLQNLFKYLPRAVKDGELDKEARQAVAHAATMAGVAFANAFLGIVHSLSHKIGGHLGVVHGMANAIYLPYVIYYNSQQGVREKQGYFSQNHTTSSRTKYAKIADLLGLGTGAESTAEKVDLLIEAIQNLTREIGLPTSTKEYGVSDEEFYDKLDIMCDEAFNDQCTGANPRIPLIKDLRQLYIDAHEGNEIPKLAKK